MTPKSAPSERSIVLRDWSDPQRLGEIGATQAVTELPVPIPAWAQRLSVTELAARSDLGGMVGRGANAGHDSGRLSRHELHEYQRQRGARTDAACQQRRLRRVGDRPGKQGLAHAGANRGIIGPAPGAPPRVAGRRGVR